MLIPVFVSAPTFLSEQQETVRRAILGELGHHGLEARAIGKTDFPTILPLREVQTLARHCSGGVILGFSQFEATAGILKRGTAYQKRVKKGATVAFATPWNQLEAGVLFALGVPLLIFREQNISGGVFDEGVTDVFVLPMPPADPEYNEKKAFRAVFQKWTAEVRHHYYRE
ncbi:MAG: hypothetical protein HOP29_06575 [Phycisphaerales bacterium]|nr:hypothetical protein [Phycisphaerales bacterium]